MRHQKQLMIKDAGAKKIQKHINLSFIHHSRLVGGLGNSCDDLSKTKGA